MAVDYQGAGKGAATGAAVGSVVPGIGTTVGGILGAAAGGLFGRRKNRETKIQKKQRELVDDLLSSLKGNGPYSGLFTANPDDFERSFAAPARARFRNQTAPQIQQKYISLGMQNSTGLEDALTRAGVDMDQLINENYLNYLQGAQNRASSAIGQILGQGAGASSAQSWGDSALEGIGGYLSSPSFRNNIEGILNAFNKQKNNQQENNQQEIPDKPRKGYVNDYS
jgi:hypothetical protein